VNVIGVQGTWSWKPGQWWAPGSEFWAHLAPHGIAPALVKERPFKWSTDAGDTWNPFRRLFGTPRFSDWEAAGESLVYFTDRMDDVVVIAHSHGGQCALFAASYGVRIRKLITIGTPVRQDMRHIIALARPYIGEWWHVTDADSDCIGWWGAFADGKVGNKREFDQADENIKIDGIKHSGLLSDPKQFHWWEDAGLAAFLTNDCPRKEAA
jgi:hypothetical protein